MKQPLVMQIILSFIALLGVERLLVRLRGRLIGWGAALVWFGGLVLFVVVVWRPEVASRFSAWLGVGRGVDAALYLGVALLFYLVLRIFIRLEKQEHLITKLVTEITLLREEARRK